MSKNNKCLFCSEKIPANRKRSAKYCSDQHYYEAKKQRSSARYYKIKAPVDEIKRNERILESLFWVKHQLKKELFMPDLQKMHFNLEISTGKLGGKDNAIWTVIGGYAYYIEPKTKVISICKT
jgi:hypothetical protein